MDVSSFLSAVQRAPTYAGQVEHLQALPPREGRFAEPSQPLPPDLEELLAARGIARLYSHQVEALEAARSGRDSVVVTGTASGKTLCYNLPILESVVADPAARALYLFPTKALAQDQHKNLLELLAGGECAGSSVHGKPKASADPPNADAVGLPLNDLWLRPKAASWESVATGVYDGDTPTAQRRRIRQEANLVLSNPDMLHASLLPYHPKWAGFLSDLRFVVLDEIHTYRGILGANVACVLHRLLRVCEHYGSQPVFLAASATIANPGELAERLIGRKVKVIDDDGAPRGRKFFALWNPAPLGGDRLARRSAADDAVVLLTQAVEEGAQALAFTRTRQAAELIHRYVKQALEGKHSRLTDQVRAYRGGYLPNERRQIEQDLFAGRLRAVAATNALELGIDVGSLDVAVLVGYPGTFASTWQQAGRSGRRSDESLAVLVAGNDPVDQYLIKHPDYFFAQSPEHAVVDPENPYVLARHLKAAAFELPLGEDDLERFGAPAGSLAQALCDEGDLNEVDGQFYFAGGQNPAVGISLRHMSDNTFSIVERRNGSRQNDGHHVIANVDAISAPELVYPEAVYLHNGESYLVRELDLDGKVAYVERRETDYYTQAVLESNVGIQHEQRASEAVPECRLAFGDVDVAWQTVAFKKIKFETRENIGMGPVDIPAQNLPTTAFWLTPGDAIRAEMKAGGQRAGEGLAGLRNLAIVALPLVAMCDSRDISGVVDSKNVGRATLIVYDRYPGGLGYSEKGFERIGQLLDICRELVEECPCEDGCPSCVGLPNLRPAIHSDPDLTRGYPMPNKAATRVLLSCLESPKTMPPARPRDRYVGR